jgi:hypothetical protein
MREQMSNTSDLAALLHGLQETRRNWEVSTGPPEPGKAGAGEPWQAHLTFAADSITTCVVQSRTDRHTLLNWTRVALPSQAGLQIPQRSARAKREVMAWPRKHRYVFALVDGSRSAWQIAALLRQPPRAVEEILNELQVMGAIIM